MSQHTVVRGIAYVFAASIGCCAVAACGGSSSSGSPDTSTSTKAVAAPSAHNTSSKATASVTSSPTLSTIKAFDGSFKDQYGYTYKLHDVSAAISVKEGDSSSDSPGSYTVEYTLKLSGKMTNTTPQGRSITIANGEGRVHLFPLYRIDSLVCTAGNGSGHNLKSTDDEQSAPYCVLDTPHGDDTPSNYSSLHPTQDVPGKATVTLTQPQYEGEDAAADAKIGTTTLPAVVETKNIKTYISQASHPVGWLMQIRDEGSSGTMSNVSACLTDDNWYASIKITGCEPKS